MKENIDNLLETDLTNEKIEAIVKKIVKTHRKNNGSTVNTKAESLSGKRFFVVSVFNRRTLFIQRSELLEEDVRRFIENNKDLLSYKQCVIGTWGTGDFIVLDVCILIENRKRAIKLGNEFNQMAIFDLNREEEIALEGNGMLPKDKQSFSDKEILSFVIRQNEE